MCSIQEEIEDDILMTPRTPLGGKKCRSCDGVAQVVLRKKDAYCRNCFINSSTHKFRATLGKSKMLKPGDKVLAVINGSYSSMALLHFIYCGLNEEKNKRLIFDVDVLFIDDGAIVGRDIEKRKETIEEVKRVSNSLRFKILISTLSEVFSDSPEVADALKINQHQEEILKNAFDNVKTMTAKEDLLHQLRQKLMLNIADKFGYGKVFTDEVGTDLAIKLLVEISTGRGSHVSSDVDFRDGRNPEIPILRPLKDFTQKEIIFYDVFHKLEPVTNAVVRMTTKLNSNSSIRKTTERTGNKLKAEDDGVDKKSDLCALCERLFKVPDDENCDTNRIQKCGRLSPSNVDDHVNEQRCCCASKSNLNPKNFFCYGCLLTLKDMDKSEEFVACLIEESKRKRNFQKMKDQISEFVID